MAMKRKKPAPQAKAPPLDWLRQSVWAGEELPDELEFLEMMESEAEPAKKVAPRPGAKRKAQNERG